MGNNSCKKDKAALIVIDMQNGFLEKESSLCIAMAKATVPVCSRVICFAREKQIPVFFVTRIYKEDGSDVEHTRKENWEAGGKPLTKSSKGPLSIEMPAEFSANSKDFYIVKPRFSAFFATELDLILRRMGVQRIYLAGTTTPNCIRTTCYDGISLDYHVTVIEDCCSSNTLEIQKANMLDMKNIGAKIIDADSFCRESEEK